MLPFISLCHILTRKKQEYGFCTIYLCTCIWGEIFHKLVVVWFCKYVLLQRVGPGHSAEARADWTAASIHSSAHSNVGNPMDTVFKNHPFGVCPRYTETDPRYLLDCWNRLAESSMQPLFINPMMLLIDRWPEVQHARKEKSGRSRVTI